MFGVLTTVLDRPAGVQGVQRASRAIQENSGPYDETLKRGLSLSTKIK